MNFFYDDDNNTLTKRERKRNNTDLDFKLQRKHNTKMTQKILNV